MRVAVIQNGLVVDVCEADQAWIDLHGGVVSDTANIGWTYDGTNFAAPVETLAQAQATQLALMDSPYVAANTSPIAYMSTTFQADQESQDLIASVITACGGSLPSGFVWFDANNAPVVMVFAQLQGLAGTILMRGQPLFYHKQAQKAAIRAATTVAEVEAISW